MQKSRPKLKLVPAPSPSVLASELAGPGFRAYKPLKMSPVPTVAPSTASDLKQKQPPRTAASASKGYKPLALLAVESRPEPLSLPPVEQKALRGHEFTVGRGCQADHAVWIEVESELKEDQTESSKWASLVQLELLSSTGEEVRLLRKIELCIRAPNLVVDLSWFGSTNCPLLSDLALCVMSEESGVVCCKAANPLKLPLRLQNSNSGYRVTSDRQWSLAALPDASQDDFSFKALVNVNFSATIKGTAFPQLCQFLELCGEHIRVLNLSLSVHAYKELMSDLGVRWDVKTSHGLHTVGAHLAHSVLSEAEWVVVSSCVNTPVEHRLPRFSHRANEREARRRKREVYLILRSILSRDRHARLEEHLAVSSIDAILRFEGCQARPFCFGEMSPEPAFPGLEEMLQFTSKAYRVLRKSLSAVAKRKHP
jgi:hypothetical protein